MKIFDFSPLYRAMQSDATFQAMSLEEREALYLEATACTVEEAYRLGEEAQQLKEQVLHLRTHTSGLIRNAIYDDRQAASAQAAISALANAQIALDRCKIDIAKVRGQLDYLADLYKVLHL